MKKKIEFVTFSLMMTFFVDIRFAVFTMGVLFFYSVFLVIGRMHQNRSLRIPKTDEEKEEKNMPVGPHVFMMNAVIDKAKNNGFRDTNDVPDELKI